jgi:hypothetical protein
MQMGSEGLRGCYERTHDRLFGILAALYKQMRICCFYKTRDIKSRMSATGKYFPVALNIHVTFLGFWEQARDGFYEKNALPCIAAGGLVTVSLYL